MDAIILSLARELGREAVHVENVVKLIDEGNTIPFIARYRKELHGTMDDTTLRTLADRLNYLRNLDKRRGEVKAAIEGQGKLTEELSAAIDAAATLAEVEDLYRPYRQKRRTRATAAREKGLEPLAQLLFAQERDCPDPEKAAQAYIDPEKGVESAEQALQGAGDIIAEWISDDAGIRKALRELWWRKADLVSSAAGKEPEDSVYRLYYQFRTPVCRAMGHQVLAINRGEREELLKAAVDMDRETALIAVRRAVLVPGAPSMAFVRSAAEDAYDRLIAPSVEREDPQHPHRTRKRGGHPQLRPKPEAPAHAAAGKGQGHHGPGPRLPQRLQGGGGGRHRQGAGYGGGLPHLWPAAEGGGH